MKRNDPGDLPSQNDSVAVLLDSSPRTPTRLLTEKGMSHRLLQSRIYLYAVFCQGSQKMPSTQTTGNSLEKTIPTLPKDE